MIVPKLWQYVIVLALLIAIPGGAYLLGAHNQHEQDLADGLKAINNANAADAARVKSIDLGTSAINITYRAEISYQTAVQTRNVEDQHHAIAQAPNLATCALPADLVRLRREQVEASRATEATGP